MCVVNPVVSMTEALIKDRKYNDFNKKHIV